MAQTCQRSKVVQKGPRWSTQLFLTIWAPFWAHLDPFEPFQTKKMIFLPQMNKVGFGGGAPDQKINFCLKCGTSPCRHDNLNSEKCKKLGM